MRTIWTAAALLAVTGTLGACGSDDSGGSGDTGGGGGPSKPANVKVGFAIPTTDATYFTAYINAVKKEAKKLGATPVFSDAKNDANTQNQQVSSFITSGAKAVVVPAADVKGSAAAIKDAADSEVPIITSNRFVDASYGGVDGANPKIHVGFSDYDVGVAAGNLIVKACEGKSACNLVIEEGTLGSSPQIERTKGIQATIKSTPGIKVVDKQSNNFDPSTAVDVTQSLLQKNKAIDVLVTHDDATAVAAQRTVKQAGRDDQIKVVGVGGSKDGIKQVASGALFGTVWVSPRQDGVLALRAAVNLVRKQPVSGLGDKEGRPTVPVPLAEVTKENVDKYPGEW